MIKRASVNTVSKLLFMGIAEMSYRLWKNIQLLQDLSDFWPFALDQSLDFEDTLMCLIFQIATEKLHSDGDG